MLVPVTLRKAREQKRKQARDADKVMIAKLKWELQKWEMWWRTWCLWMPDDDNDLGQQQHQQQQQQQQQQYQHQHQQEELLGHGHQERQGHQQQQSHQQLLQVV